MSMKKIGALMVVAASATLTAVNAPSATNKTVAAQAATNVPATVVEKIVPPVATNVAAGVSNVVMAAAASTNAVVAAAASTNTVVAASASTNKAVSASAPVQSAASVARMGETDELKVEGVNVVGAENEDGSLPTTVQLADPTQIMLGANTRVDITCEDATIRDILRQFRKTVGANIISVESSNLNQRVSVRLNNAPWLASLESILATRSFRLETRDGAYFVAENRQAAIPLFTRTYKLKHASAEELALLFNKSYGEMAPDGKTVKKGVALAYPSANVVIVTAEQKVLSDCEAIIAAVDDAVSQIYIEARFIELSNEALHKLGVQWNQLESWGASAKGLSAGVEYNNGRVARYAAGTTTTTTGGGTGTGTEGGAAPTTTTTTKNYLTPASIGEALGAGRTETDMAWRNARGFSGQLSADDFKIALSAFEQMNDVKVFSNPKVVVSNGKEATVDMTTKFPNVRVQATRNTSNGSDSFDISTQLEVIPGEDKLMFAKESFYSWGITLNVKPRVAPDGIINVEIVPTISQLDNTSVTDYTGFYKVSGGDSSAYSSYPVIDVKRITTDFTMKDGSTAVIGGLSKTTEEEVDSGIPYLRKIPWIGQKLFGWKSRQKVQKEIVVFVTLGIANPEEMKPDVGLPKNAVLGREYVAGREFEPGDRANALESLMTLDKSDIEDRRGKVDAEPSNPDAQPARPAIKVKMSDTVLPAPSDEKADPPAEKVPAAPAPETPSAPAGSPSV